MRLAIVSLVLGLAGPAHALSCLPPDFARSYADVAQAEARFTMVVGVLDFDPEQLPRVDWQRQQDTPPETHIPARLTGRSFQADGFTGRFALDVTLRVLCFGPWCGGATSGAEVLAFVNLDDKPPSVEVTPCGGHVFGADPATLARALACYRGEDCAAEDF
ncbi:hypothetical protein [Primorskyibacter sp. S187A]|uniref:hypothetical protein n=1 Tax=Primorskyibacter sp. S187A TaxID=3415130 RepID=UPI003C7AC5F1